MFVVCIHVQNRDKLEGPWHVRSGFEGKEDAAKFLGMISGHSADIAGFDAQQDFWWTRAGDVVTRYSIAVGSAQSAPSETGGPTRQ